MDSRELARLNRELWPVHKHPKPSSALQRCKSIPDRCTNPSMKDSCSRVIPRPKILNLQKPVKEVIPDSWKPTDSRKSSNNLSLTGHLVSPRRGL